MIKREPVLLKELKTIKVPEREYRFYRKIWSPKNWIVMKRDCNTDEDPIPVAAPIVFENELCIPPPPTDPVN